MVQPALALFALRTLKFFTVPPATGTSVAIQAAWRGRFQPQRPMKSTTPNEFARTLTETVKHLTLKDILQGKPIGHPLHPFLVHLPTALWPTALVFDILAYARHNNDPALSLTAWWCILVGLIAAVAAIPTGVADWLGIRPGRPARKLGLLHAGLNIAVFGLFVANFTLRCLRGPHEPSVTGTQLTLSAIAVALLITAAYFGGLLVYDYGIAIGRTSKKYWKAIAIAGGAEVSAE
jgi:uncharacterized membrane protein